MNHGHHHQEDGLPRPAVYVLEASVDLSQLSDGTDVRTALAAFVAAFLAELKAGGCRLIGHVKGALDGAAAGCLYFNATTLHGGATISGELSGGQACRLTMNAIVYTIEHREVERAALGALERCLGRSGT